MLRSVLQKCRSEAREAGLTGMRQSSWNVLPQRGRPSVVLLLEIEDGPMVRVEAGLHTNTWHPHGLHLRGVELQLRQAPCHAAAWNLNGQMRHYLHQRKIGGARVRFSMPPCGFVSFCHLLTSPASCSREAGTSLPSEFAFPTGTPAPRPSSWVGL
eukprot:TRINITY_DN21381_c1_g2_i2.p1 TRINITY_DN21381_c1_g2~~TRINITY_DN21381_c1_g2_i2.p1  ORF type:complete len:156 (-),score=6.31 TRINITY_DN21381_c1_g2_i2:98-565(-)